MGYLLNGTVEAVMLQEARIQRAASQVFLVIVPVNDQNSRFFL